MQHFRSFSVIFWAFLLFYASPTLAAAPLGVPFTSQAPFGNWASPWQDFCEEASVVMAAHFVWGLPITPEIADLEMQLIRKYEEFVFGRYKDTSVDATASILKNLYGFKNITVKKIASTGDIKKEITAGNIVIVPAAGRMLKNPNFRGPGPLYHMLVVHGFDDVRDVFISHDPGTRNGKNFSYNQTSLFNAIHDWNYGDVMRGEKKMIVVGK